MAEWMDLATLALVPGDARRVVGRRGQQQFTHADFVAGVRAWHAAFAAHGGERFALYFDDPCEFAAALFGAWHAGKEAVLPGDVQPATVQRLLPEVDGCAGLLPGAIAPAAASQDAPGPLDLERTRLVMYTSGSSGQPLAIAKRLRQLDAEVRNLQAAFGHTVGDECTVLSTVTHQHIYGLLFGVLWPLAAGRAVDCERVVYPEQIAYKAASPCVLVSSPAHLRRLPEGIAWTAARTGLRAVFSSGGPLPPESAQQALQMLGHSPIEVYGSTETGGIAWRQRATHGDRWDALPHVAWRVEEGVLHVQSQHLPDRQWWETSDRAQARDGGFVLQGRADRIVKVEEKRVSLAALEQALASSGWVAEAKALLVPGEAGARIAVVAVPSERGWDLLRGSGKQALNEALRAQLLQSVERVALPRRFRYVRELPMNSQGKATEALLLALFQPWVPQAVWRERDANHAVAVLEVEPGLRVFDGHFPQALVLPGVAQLDWAAELGGRCFALPPRFARADQLKFNRPILPPLQVELTLQWEPSAGQLSFRYASAQGLHSSGRLVFEAADV